MKTWWQVHIANVREFGRDFSTLQSTPVAYCALINKLHINAFFFYANPGQKGSLSMQRHWKLL